MLTADMVPLLACPVCHEPLAAQVQSRDGEKINAGKLVCSVCDAEYEILTGIPNLMPTEINQNEKWQLWNQHLAAFDARRHKREAGGGKLPHPGGGAMHRAFFEFAGISQGTVLDLGCGPGKLRKYLNEDKVTYIGLDPLQIEDTKNFRFVHALAEFIPFQAATFSHLLVISALDHFNDLAKFFREARRVLKKDGVLLILQSTHEVTGLISAAKMLTHRAKDAMDSLATRGQYAHVPKHLNEFTRSSLLQAAEPYFSLARSDVFSKSWYAPNKLFLALEPVHAAPAEEEPVQSEA